MNKKSKRPLMRQPSTEGLPNDVGYRMLTEEEIKALQRHQRETLQILREAREQEEKQKRRK